MIAVIGIFPSIIGSLKDALESIQEVLEKYQEYEERAMDKTEKLKGAFELMSGAQKMCSTGLSFAQRTAIIFGPPIATALPKHQRSRKHHDYVKERFNPIELIRDSEKGEKPIESVTAYPVFANSITVHPTFAEPVYAMSPPPITMALIAPTTKAIIPPPNWTPQPTFKRQPS